jgi:hypothetical protein
LFLPPAPHLGALELLLGRNAVVEVQGAVGVLLMPLVPLLLLELVLDLRLLERSHVVLVGLLERSHEMLIGLLEGAHVVVVVVVPALLLVPVVLLR